MRQNDLWSVYDEMREMSDHLLTRIEMLEDDVERLTEENYDYARELYTIERSIDERINILLGEVTNISEGQESSEVNYQEGKEAS